VTLGDRVLKSVTAKDGTRRVVLPKLRPGKHRLVVRYAGTGTVEAVTERVVVRVARR